MSDLIQTKTNSSAAKTAFCAERVDVGNGRHLFVDGNGKITASNGTLAKPRPNAFSLVQIEDCPEATPTCKASCYVHGLEAHAPDTHALYRHNSRVIREILSSSMRDYRVAARRLGAWIRENVREFRWHVSGDVFSARYAEFIVDACAHSTAVRHWIYTRRTDMVILRELARARNLTINLSADRDNYHWMKMAYARLFVRLTYMATGDGHVPDDLPPGSVIFPDYSLRGRDLEDPTSSPWWRSLTLEQRKMVCPVDFFGKSEKRRCGPCDKCIRPVA